MADISQYDRLNMLFETLKSGRANTDNTRQQIAEDCFGRADFTVKREPGENRQQRIYDGTSRVSSSLLSGVIHSLMTNPFARWFELAFEKDSDNEIEGAAEWLHAAQKHMYSVLSSPGAGFHSQMHEVYRDLIDFGMASMFVDDAPLKGVRFSARPLQEMYFAEDPSGVVDTIIRSFELTARQAVTLWGDKVKLASAALETTQSEGKHPFLHIVLPADDFVIGNVDLSGKPWRSFHLSLGDKVILDEKGFHEMPYATPRWEKDTGEVYGRGPGWNALSDQQMLQEMKKVQLIAAQLEINPVRMVDSETALGTDLSWHPGSTIVVDSLSSSMDPPIQVLRTGSNFQVSDFMIGEARKQVQDAFQHQLVETIRDPRMTATQVLELSATMQRHLAPILGRLQTEMLEPILERVFAIEARAGHMPAPPADLAASAAKVNMNYVSPVARAQQTSDARAVIDYLGFVGNLAAVAPEALDVVNIEAQLRTLAEALGVPPDGINSIEVVKTIRAARENLAAEAEAERQAVVVTDQAAKLAKATNQGVAA